MPISHSIRPLVLAVLLSFSGSLYAAGDKTVYKPSKRIQYSEQELKTERERRSKIVEHTQSVFSLLSAEMAYNQGEIGTAIGLYLNTLRQTQNPDVAERAMELAINARAYPLAEMIYQEWQKIEPNPGSAQRRLALFRAFAMGDTAIVLADLDGVLAEADNDQRRRLFILATTTGMVHPSFGLHIGTAIHRNAAKYPELAEAAIADALYNAYAKREDKAIAALNRLASLDTDIKPATRLSMEMLAQSQPETFNRFFEQRQSHTLPVAWRELEIDSLINSKRYNEAQIKLNKLLDKSPDARLHIKAGTLAIATDGDEQSILGHLNKAHQSGTDDTPSRAALIATLYLSGKGNYDKAAYWADKITAPDLAFNQLSLKAAIASEQKNWEQAYRHAVAAEKLSEQNGSFVSTSDVYRIRLYAATQIMPPAKALAELNRAYTKVERRPTAPDYKENISTILYHRGLLYSDKLQQHARAIADFRRYVSLNPDNANGMNALGYTLLSGNRKQIEEAFKWIERAYRLDPDNPQINDSMGWAYHKKGDAVSALPYLEFAYEQDPDPEVAAHLGAVLWALNKHDDARRIWKEAHSKNPKHTVLNQILNQHNITMP